MHNYLLSVSHNTYVNSHLLYSNSWFANWVLETSVLGAKLVTISGSLLVPCLNV